MKCDEKQREVGEEQYTCWEGRKVVWMERRRRGLLITAVKESLV